MATSVFEVAPIELPSDGILSLRVPIPGGDSFYYAEYRRAHGFDRYRDSGDFFEGLLIHRAPDYSRATQPVLIDTVPETDDVWDAWLGDGRTFRDDVAGISISLLSHTPNAALVRVQVGDDCGECGCVLPYPDVDDDRVPDCAEVCDEDPEKTEPGACGCGLPDSDRDADGLLDCKEECPDDPEKTAPGECGCGQSDKAPCEPSGEGDGDAGSTDEEPAGEDTDDTETEKDPVSEAPVSDVVVGHGCQLMPLAPAPALPLLALSTAALLRLRRRNARRSG
jgi:hypothetical protein